MPEFADDLPWTVEALESDFEGSKHDTHQQGRSWECDYCSKGVNVQGGYEAYMYLADDVLGGDYNQQVRQIHRERPLVPLAAYDTDHTFSRLLFPCKGYTEVRMVFECAADRTIETAEVTDISARDDGIPWKPAEASEKITEISFDEHAQMLFISEGHLWGPENMITFFMSVGIDPREFIKWDGSFDPKGVGRARKRYEKFMEYMRDRDYDRQTFRNAVLDDEDVVE